MAASIAKSYEGRIIAQYGVSDKVEYERLEGIPEPVMKNIAKLKPK
jgi:hypothetical protein